MGRVMDLAEREKRKQGQILGEENTGGSMRLQCGTICTMWERRVKAKDLLAQRSV